MTSQTPRTEADRWLNEATCEWCGAKLTPIGGIWTDEATGSGDYCPEGLAVGRGGTSPHLPRLAASSDEDDGPERGWDVGGAMGDLIMRGSPVIRPIEGDGVQPEPPPGVRSIEQQLDDLAVALAGPLGTDIRIERIRSALPAAFREYRDWGLAIGRSDHPGLPRLLAAVDAVLRLPADTDPIPDDEWDPVFIELREARKTVLVSKGPGETAVAALWECYRESGADTDGDEGPGAMIAGMGEAGFASAVVDSVRRLRLDYRDALGEVGGPGETAGLRAALDAIPMLAVSKFTRHRTWCPEDGGPADCTCGLYALLDSILCTCGHTVRHHLDRDVDDVAGWPCMGCRSKRCRRFALAATQGPGEP